MISGMTTIVVVPDAAMSYGTIQLCRNDRAGTIWAGFYVRMQIDAGLSWSKDLERIDMRWQRLRPSSGSAAESADPRAS